MPQRNNVARISPIASAMTMWGIVCLAFIPPAGLILLIAAFFVQRKYRHDILAGRSARAEAVRRKQRDTQLAAALKFCRS